MKIFKKDLISQGAGRLPLMSRGWDQDESHVGTSSMICAPAIEALKEPPRKSAQ